MKRLILGFIVAVLIAAAVWAQPAPTIYGEHNGVNLTHFQCQIDSGPLVALYGLVTQNGGTYSTALSNCGTLSAGSHLLYIYACNNGYCAVSGAIYVVKL